MDVQGTVADAIVAELQRQAEVSEGALRVDAGEPGSLSIEGRVDLDALIMVVTGALAGGP